MNLSIYVDKIDDIYYYVGNYNDILFGERLISKTLTEATLESIKLAASFVPEQVEMIFVNDIVTANFLSTKKAPTKYVQSLVDRVHTLFPVASFHHFAKQPKNLVDELYKVSERKINEKNVKAVTVGGYQCLRCLYNKIGKDGKPKCTKHNPRIAEYEDGW